ncbi:hypothetical protein Aab01nite_18690 [Paractinoplanes abujensis]|nr:hypothetical protein Aab01nite_18690 [Actinoplanes abujensis]
MGELGGLLGAARVKATAGSMGDLDGLLCAGWVKALRRAEPGRPALRAALASDSRSLVVLDGGTAAA